MSGKRQHFIPRFLQRGFVSHTKNDEAYTWVYRKEAPVFNTNIVNVGVEHFFYEEVNHNADDLITEAEGEFADLVQDLRAEVTDIAHDPRVPQLLAHLEVRTRHFRESLLRTGEFLVSMLSNYVSDGSVLVELIQRRLHEDPSLLRNLISTELAKYGLSSDLVEPLTRLSAASLPEAMELVKQEAPRMAQILRSTLPQALETGARSGHIRALTQSVSPKLRVQRYSSLGYTLLTTADQKFILGDSAVLFHVKGERTYKPFLDKADVLRSVILPLSPRMVLIGTNESTSLLPRDLSAAIARCSLEYFIAHERTEANEALQSTIGENAHLLTKRELEEIVVSVLS